MQVSVIDEDQGNFKIWRYQLATDEVGANDMMRVINADYQRWLML